MCGWLFGCSPCRVWLLVAQVFGGVGLVSEGGGGGVFGGGGGDRDGEWVGAGSIAGVGTLSCWVLAVTRVGGVTSYAVYRCSPWLCSHLIVVGLVVCRRVWCLW